MKSKSLVECHFLLGIGVEQRWPDRGELQPLINHAGRDEEGRSDLLLCAALLAHRLEGAELVERTQRRALDVLGEAVHLASPSVRTMQGTSMVLFMRFCFTRSSSARDRRSPAGIAYMPVLAPLSSSTGRTVMELSSVRRVMSSASSSIDTPALRGASWIG